VSDSRRFVYVSGAPGSGKTSLAVPLAAELGYALLTEYDRPVGIGALVTVDTTIPVDVTAVAAAVRDCYDRTREE
jgi:predicted ATPase